MTPGHLARLLVAIGVGAALAGASPAVAAATGPPAVSPRPPLGPGGPPLPLGRPLPVGTDRAARTTARQVDSMRGPALGGAPGSLRRGLSDADVLRHSTSAGRDRLLNGARREGVRIVRVTAEWRVHAGTRPRRPTDPDDPAYDFSGLDSIMRAVARARLEPLMIVSHAPPWAEAPGRWAFAPNGSWGVSAKAAAAFGVALGRRYSGRHVPAGATRPLPRVRLFQFWNEPNLPAYLSPQWTGVRGVWNAWSPRHYRYMLNAFYAAVKRARPDTVIATAGLAPNGDALDGQGRMAPVRFLRAFLCLDPRGAVARPRCPDPPRMDAIAFHPLSTGSPDLPAVSRLDIGVADIGKVDRVVRAAVRAGVLRRRPPLWVTEVNWVSPPEAAAARLRARWVGRAFHRLWRAGATMAIWQFERDRAGERPAGLRHRDGRARPVLRGFRFPLDLVRADGHHVRAWTLPPRSGRVCVERRARGGWVRLRCAHASPERPLELEVRVGGGAVLRATAAGRRSAATPIGP